VSDVIAVLAALIAPNVLRHVGAAKAAAARSPMEMPGAALDAYLILMAPLTISPDYPISHAQRPGTAHSCEDA
jgi:hypothetical protein